MKALVGASRGLLHDYENFAAGSFAALVSDDQSSADLWQIPMVHVQQLPNTRTPETDHQPTAMLLLSSSSSLCWSLHLTPYLSSFLWSKSKLPQFLLQTFTFIHLWISKYWRFWQQIGPPTTIQSFYLFDFKDNLGIGVDRIRTNTLHERWSLFVSPVPVHSGDHHLQCQDHCYHGNILPLQLHRVCRPIYLIMSQPYILGITRISHGSAHNQQRL